MPKPKYGRKPINEYLRDHGLATAFSQVSETANRLAFLRKLCECFERFGAPSPEDMLFSPHLASEFCCVVRVGLSLPKAFEDYYILRSLLSARKDRTLRRQDQRTNKV